MVDHRRTLTRKAVVLPGWFLVLVAVLCLAGAGTVGALVLTGDDDGGSVVAPTPTATSDSPSASPSPSATPSPSASPSPTRTPKPKPSRTSEPEPEVERSAVAVSVLNASRTTGLARQVGARVSQSGWTLGGVGNWRGYVAANTVHHPAGREAEAKLLAEDLGIGTVAPALAGMRTDRLTVLVIALP